MTLAETDGPSSDKSLLRRIVVTGQEAGVQLSVLRLSILGYYNSHKPKHIGYPRGHLPFWLDEHPDKRTRLV